METLDCGFTTPGCPVAQLPNVQWSRLLNDSVNVPGLPVAAGSNSTYCPLLALPSDPVTMLELRVPLSGSMLAVNMVAALANKSVMMPTTANMPPYSTKC